jgi:hypothetical protein
MRAGDHCLCQGEKASPEPSPPKRQVVRSSPSAVICIPGGTRLGRLCLELARRVTVLTRTMTLSTGVTCLLRQYHPRAGGGRCYLGEPL